MMRKYVNFIFDKEWSYLFAEDDIVEPAAIMISGIVRVNTLHGGQMKIRMDKVVAVEFFERDFEADAEAKEQEAADAEPRH